MRSLHAPGLLIIIGVIAGAPIAMALAKGGSPNVDVSQHHFN